jgi:hypothetical protein
MNFKQLATATALGWTLSIAQAEVPAPQLPAFFDKLNPSVVEVEIHKPDDNRTYSTGTGFLAGSKHWVVTNFLKGTNMRVEFCEREVDTLDGLAYYAARGFSLNGGNEHALFSFYLEVYSQKNATKVLEAVLDKV